MKKSTIEPPYAELKSLKHKDLIDCILESIAEIEYYRCEEDPNFGNWDQEEWLRDVTNRPHGWNRDEFGEIDPNPVINWDKPVCVSTAILLLAGAGKKLNVRKLEEEGIEDFIGSHFPKFKDNPNYQPYPKNYNFNMTLNQFLNIPQSNADFLCQYWRPEHCDPNNWNAPSTYGVEGIILVDRDGNTLEEGDKSGMHLKEIGAPSDNPTRYQGTALGRVDHYYKVITDPDKGIKCLDPIYYNIETGNTLNGNGREGAAKKAGVTGWMYQPVRVVHSPDRTIKETELRFGAESQPKEEDGVFQTPLSKDDVYTTVKEIYEESGNYNLESVYADVEHYGKHLVTGDKNSIKTKLKKEFEENGDMESTDQFQPYDSDTYETFLNKIPDDEWVKDIFNNEDERVQFINANKFNHYYSNIMNSGLDAKSDEESPLHFIVTFPISESTTAASLQALRDSFFSKYIAKIENTMMKLTETAVNDRNRLMFPWNHPDCKHVALAQDRKNEKNSVVVPLVNRKFN